MKKYKLNLIAKTITLVLLSGASLNSFATTNENPNKIRKDVNYNDELNRLNARIIASKNDTANLNTTANVRGAVVVGLDENNGYSNFQIFKFSNFQIFKFSNFQIFKFLNF